VVLSLHGFGFPPSIRGVRTGGPAGSASERLAIPVDRPIPRRPNFIGAMGDGTRKSPFREVFLLKKEGRLRRTEGLRSGYVI